MFSVNFLYCHIYDGLKSGFSVEFVATRLRETNSIDFLLTLTETGNSYTLILGFPQ